MLIWTNFDSFTITYLSNLLQKFHFPIETVLFFANTKGSGTNFQVAVFVEFFDEIFSFIM